MAFNDERIEVELADGNKLVVVRNGDTKFSKELFVGIVGESDFWMQDLAVIRPSYSYNNDGNVEWMKDRFDILIYGDCDDEDYTDDFVINLHNYDEE